MRNDITSFIKLIVSFLPFILFAFLNGKANTKKEVRCRQYPMPVLAVVYSVVVFILLQQISELLKAGFLALADLIGKVSFLEFVANAIRDIYYSWGVYLSLILFNTAALLAYIIVKRIITAIMAKIGIDPETRIGKLVEVFYTYDQEDEAWYIKEHFGQARTFIKAVYYGSCAATGLAMLISCGLCMDHKISAPFILFLRSSSLEKWHSLLMVSASRKANQLWKCRRIGPAIWRCILC